MVFEPDTYSESWTIMENIIVEARREFFLQNRDKTAGQSGKKRVLLGPLARSVSSVSAVIWRYFTVKYSNFVVFKQRLKALI
jgi:hypothetical protein